MKKKWFILACALCISLSGCRGSDLEDKTHPSSTNTDITPYETKLSVLKPMAYSTVDGLELPPGSYISIIGRNSNDSFWDEIEAGARQAVADLNAALGYKGEDKILLNYIAPNQRDDVEEQISILDEELDRYPAAIGIAMIDATACQVQFDLAIENQIPIIVFDSGSEYQGVAATCATNNKKAAQTAATQMASAIENTGEVVVIVQDSKSMTATDRQEGFTKKIKDTYPDIQIAGVYYMDQLDAIAEEMNQEIEEEADKVNPAKLTEEEAIQWIIRTHPNLKGIFCTNLDTTQWAANTIKSLQRTDLKMIGFDGGEEQIALIEDGTLEGLILQNPYGMGYATVVAGVRASLNMNNEAQIDSGFTWVTNTNLQQSSIQNMLY